MGSKVVCLELNVIQGGRNQNFLWLGRPEGQRLTPTPSGPTLPDLGPSHGGVSISKVDRDKDGVQSNPCASKTARRVFSGLQVLLRGGAVTCGGGTGHCGPLGGRLLPASKGAGSCTPVGGGVRGSGTALGLEGRPLCVAWGQARLRGSAAGPAPRLLVAGVLHKGGQPDA